MVSVESGALPLPMRTGTFQNLALAVLRQPSSSMSRPTILSALGHHAISWRPSQPRKHHLDLTDGVLLPDGAVRFPWYLDGGTAAAASNVMTAGAESQ